MRTYYDRTYYTLDDIDLIVKPTRTTRGPFAMKTTPAVWFADVLKKYGNSGAFSDFGSKYLSILWQQYIWPKYFNSYVCFTDGDTVIDADDLNDIDLLILDGGTSTTTLFDGSNAAIEAFVDNVAGQIVTWMKTSDDKFSVLIKNQEDNKANLLQQIKSTNISRFNDTPQNQGSYDDDAHNTTTTKAESATDGGTLLSRLNEIEDNLKRLYEDWSKEFRKFIIWSVR